MESTYADGTAQEKNLEAALSIFSEHGKAIHRMVAYHVKDPSTADDLCQDLFISLVKRPIPVHVKTPLSYLWRAIANDVKDAVRKRTSYDGMRERYRLRAIGREAAADPCTSFEDQERTECLAQLIEEHLSPHEAKALMDRYVRCKSLSDSAKNSNVKVRTLSRYLCVGVKRLRSKLGDDAALTEFFL